MTQRCFLPVAVVALLMTTAAMETSAQPSPAGSLPRVDDALVGVPGFYFITRPGDALIQVTAVGIVANQGRYAVSAGTPLADLLAYAGGAAVDRTGTARVRLYRDGSQLFERDVR
ncbi:MAG: SLBB domain-containing protein, partial [Bacteroidota bacterium]